MNNEQDIENKIKQINQVVIASITDPVTGSVEELSTPVIALINDSCVGALTENTSSENDKVLWNYSFYSLEPIDHMFGYVFSALKAATSNDNRGIPSRELLSKIASISSANPRIANISFEFDLILTKSLLVVAI